ncbi:MAG: hypothetical protein GY930_17685 [bacterium]|nr:hypothetical protein [bacterium]
MKSPFPKALKLSIDDLGVFHLLVGDELPIGEFLLGRKHAEANWVVSMGQTMHAGVRWTLTCVGDDRVLVPGEICTLGAQRYAIHQPDPASPLLWLQSLESDMPGVLLLAPGELEGFAVGPPGSAWVLEGVQHAIQISALPGGLRIACEGGVRYSKGDGEFDGARPHQEASWSRPGQQMFWNAVHAGSGPPFFVTLEPLVSPLAQ